MEDALHLGTAIEVGVVGFVVALLLGTEVHASRQFADADEIGTADEVVLEGRLVDEAVEGLDGTDVGKEPELLAHGEETLFGAYLCGGIVVELRVADGAEENGVALHAELMGLGGIRVANGIDGMSATNAVIVMELMAVLLTDGFGDLEGLAGDFGTNAVARENC